MEFHIITAAGTELVARKLEGKLVIVDRRQDTEPQSKFDTKLTQEVVFVGKLQQDEL